ncbi:TonB-dependent receptor plug domain-containing protein [Pontixanthobacter aquaemixtae]|uniref:TonB-dependent receptor n=1 Tax=Pontixanthobacter aquaemixtae TaxID=1958940 RepID=A0A844ZUU8_9SPHN|nr:TonB-dependent receptor [Pontixanthobacter aquaemixtae]MXO89319.1 TonB-dependent receptor [Pontixanthobacter aquaemixtae]
MRFSLKFAVSALALISAAPAFAQDEDPREQDEADIIVKGQGLEDSPAQTAYSSIELDRVAITTSASGRIEDVLSSVAGFQQFRRSDSRSSNPSAQGVTLRALGGNATSRALVLLDGVPMADPFFGYIPLSAIAPERLDTIRVTRGGGSGPFGAGALAGTIELNSADANMLGPVSGSVFVNDRGETEASGSIAQNLGSGFAVLSGRWDRGQGFFTTPEDQRVPATARAGFDSWSFGVRGAAPLTDSIELQARGLVFNDERVLRFDGADSSSEGADASIRIVGRGDWQFDAVGYLQSRNFSNVVISSTRFVRVLDQRNTPSTGLGGKFEIRPPVGADHVLRMGMDYRRSSGELQEEAYSAFTGSLRERRRAGGRNSDFGVFIEDDWLIGDLVLTGGIRANRTVIENGFYRAVDADNVLVDETIAPDRADWSFSYRAGVSYDASDGLRLRAAAYRGLRLPTLNELYRPFVVFPVVTQANDALENEQLEGFEAGVDFTPAEGVELSVTAFNNRVENAIANVTLSPTLRQRQNLSAIEARGIEAGASITAGQISFNGTIAYTDAQVDGSGASLALDGNRPPQMPEFAASATVAWKPAKNWLLSATLRHVGAQFESDQETDVLPAATTLDAFAQIPLSGKFSLVLRGENLFDETIVTRNSDGALDLGVPRTVWGGIRFGF